MFHFKFGKVINIIMFFAFLFATTIFFYKICKSFEKSKYELSVNVFSHNFFHLIL